MSEFVWRSGSCGSAVSIHHGSAAVGQFPIFPSLRAPTAPPSSALRSDTAAESRVGSSHLFGARRLYTKASLAPLERLGRGGAFSCNIDQGCVWTGGMWISDILLITSACDLKLGASAPGGNTNETPLHLHFPPSPPSFFCLPELDVK